LSSVPFGILGNFDGSCDIHGFILISSFGFRNLKISNFLISSNNDSSFFLFSFFSLGDSFVTWALALDLSEVSFSLFQGIEKLLSLFELELFRILDWSDQSNGCLLFSFSLEFLSSLCFSLNGLVKRFSDLLRIIVLLLNLLNLIFSSTASLAHSTGLAGLVIS
jgi:hypothetical protein